MRQKPRGYRPKPITEMDNPGGIGAAITAREAKLGAVMETLGEGKREDGRPLTPNKRSRLRHTIRTLEAELAILYERRATLAPATAHRASNAKISDWE